MNTVLTAEKSSHRLTPLGWHPQYIQSMVPTPHIHNDVHNQSRVFKITPHPHRFSLQSFPFSLQKIPPGIKQKGFLPPGGIYVAMQQNVSYTIQKTHK